MIRKGLLPVLGALTLSVGCRDAFTAHSDVVARVGDNELSVTRLSQLFVAGRNLPLRQETVDQLARHWAEVVMVATRTAAGDSLLDSALVLEVMWPDVRQSLINEFRLQMVADQPAIESATVDNVYRMGEMRSLAHILVRVSEDSLPEQRARQRAKAESIYQRLIGGGSWQDANEQNEDENAKASGGNLGIIPRGQTVPRFENAAFALDPGEISEVVETQFGYHILYRPTLEDVRDAFTAAVTQQRAVQIDSAYSEGMLEDRRVEVKSTAPAEIRELAASPLRGLGSTKVLAATDDGPFTSGQFVRWLQVLPVQVNQLIDAPDDQLINFTRQLVFQELLWNRVVDSGISLSDSAFIALRVRYRNSLAVVWNGLGIYPDSLELLGQSAEERERITLQRVDIYLEGFVTQQIPLLQVPPFLAAALREDMEWEIVTAGVARAMEEAGRLRQVLPGATVVDSALGGVR